MKYVSIDIETTGLDPNSCQILEFGAIIDDLSKPWNGGVEFHCYIDNRILQGDPYAFSMHPKILRRIATKEFGYSYLKPEKLAPWFREFLNGHDMGDEIVVAGKNFAIFDARFLRRMPCWSDLININFRILDPGILWWNPEVDGVKLPSMKQCMERACIGGEVPHLALEDAAIVAQLIRRGI